VTAHHPSPADVVRRWVDEAWNQSEADARRAVLLALHPARFRNEGEDATPDLMIDWHLRMRATFPDLHYEVDDLVEAGPRVILRWTASGTHRGTLWGLLPATGRTVTWRGIHLLTVEGGRIIEVWAAAEWVEVLQQLGAQLLPGEAAEG
jgi:predicted ester cyclase